MTEFALTFVGGWLLAFSLGLPYMKVMEKQGWPDGITLLGVITLIGGIVLLAIAPYPPGV